MTTIRAFRALRYDPKRVDLSRVLAPPYDVIAPEERHALYDRDPYNAVRLELTRNVADEATTDYTAVRETLATWREAGVLVPQRDVETTANSLQELLSDPERRARLARAGRQRAERLFDARDVAACLKGWFDASMSTIAG